MSRPFSKLIILALLISQVGLAVPRSSSASTLVASSKAEAFHDAMRKLWEDHITWTRVFIISAAGDLPDKATATDRLLQNQVDIGNAIKPYYGDAAGNKLTALLKEHIQLPRTSSANYWTPGAAPRTGNPDGNASGAVKVHGR